MPDADAPTPEPCAWRIRPDGECCAPSTTVVWGDDHDEVRYVCAEHLPEALRIGWTTDGPELPAPVNAGTLAGLGHAAEQAQALGDAVARFNALSDAAGNPSAPTPPGTPEGALSYALGEAERRARHRPGHTPLQARDVLAGLTELGWTLHPGLPHPAVLAQIHERLDRIEYVTENIAAAVDDPPPVDRTLSAMDRVERHDAEAVIVGALTDWFEPPIDPTEVGTLAIRIAQALYGPTTEPAPMPGPGRPPWLRNGARVVHATYGPGTVDANAWTPDEGYTARIEWDGGWPNDVWIPAGDLTPTDPDGGAPTEGDG